MRDFSGDEINTVPLDASDIDALVREMFGALRSSHLELVAGSSQGALNSLDQAFISHRQLDRQAQAGTDQALLVGQVLRLVIHEQLSALCDLAADTVEWPLPTSEAGRFIAKPTPGEPVTAGQIRDQQSRANRRHKGVTRREKVNRA